MTRLGAVVAGRRMVSMGRFFNKENRPVLMLLAQASSIGLAMVLAIVFGTALGYWVDKTWGTGPWGLLVGLLMGIIAAFRNLYILGKRAQKLGDK